MKPNPKSVRLWLRQIEDGSIAEDSDKIVTKHLCSLTDATYLGEYIARSVKKKPAKKKGAKRGNKR